MRSTAAPGFVEVEAGDFVVDCGGFVGGFSTSIADIAGVVHVVEPSPQNFRALLRNIADRSNVHAHNIGLFDRDSTLTLNLSSTFVDDSFLSPDAGATGRTVQVRVRRVDEWARELGLERIDFMKVEAEGVETEIVRSIGDFPVGKVAVDCSPERDGLSNLDDVAAHLEAKGFAVRPVDGCSLLDRRIRNLVEQRAEPSLQPITAFDTDNEGRCRVGFLALQPASSACTVAMTFDRCRGAAGRRSYCTVLDVVQHAERPRSAWEWRPMPI